MTSGRMTRCRGWTLANVIVPSNRPNKEGASRRDEREGFGTSRAGQDSKLWYPKGFYTHHEEGGERVSSFVVLPLLVRAVNLCYSRGERSN